MYVFILSKDCMVNLSTTIFQDLANSVSIIFHDIKIVTYLYICMGIIISIHDTALYKYCMVNLVATIFHDLPKGPKATFLRVLYFILSKYLPIVIHMGNIISIQKILFGKLSDFCEY